MVAHSWKCWTKSPFSSNLSSIFRNKVPFLTPWALPLKTKLKLFTTNSNQWNQFLKFVTLYFPIPTQSSVEKISGSSTSNSYHREYRSPSGVVFHTVSLSSRILSVSRYDANCRSYLHAAIRSIFSCITWIIIVYMNQSRWTYENFN